MSHATHANAALTPRHRLRLARLIVDHGWPVARAAERYDVSWQTADKWAERYAARGRRAWTTGPRARTGSRTGPRQPLVRKIVHLRWKQRLGPVADRGRLGMPASTVHAVLVRCRLNRLSHIDRGTGEPIRRYEHEIPATDPRGREEARQHPRRRRLALRRAAAGRPEPGRDRARTGTRATSTANR